jgi:16S rRNA (adenine1518-N6/adenine1519-N6)-dimethyltransferase
MKEHPPRAKRSLGQNFLSDPNYIRKIIDAVAVSPEDTVIEIGPGRGALTERLIASGAKVIAIELDRELISPLRARFAGTGRFVVTEANALEADLASLASEPVKLAANLPYYISTAILQKLADQREAFSSLLLMFQKEVVDRITAKPGHSERGYLTVLTELAFDVEKLFDVPPAAFRPSPKVMSSVVRLAPRIPRGDDEDILKALVSQAFRQKRKTLLNNLRPHFPQVAGAFERSGIDGSRRAESLSLDEWRRLCEALGR